MSSTIRNTTCFLSLLIFIYALRQAQVSPGSFLKHHIVRFAQEQKLSETFCTEGRDGLTFSSDEYERAESYRNGLSNIRKADTLANFIERGEPKSTFAENYGKSFIPYLVPWVVFFGLGILGCSVYLINWCFMNCACLKKRACGCCRTPESSMFKNCFVVLSTLFMVFAVGAGVAGIIFVSEFPKYSNAVLCSMVKFIEKAQDGSTEDKWIGAGPGINKIDELVFKVNNAVDGLSVYDSLFADFDESLNQVSNSLNALYDNNKDRTLDRINPDEGTYQPFYIQELGPSTQDGTVTNLIGNELDKSRQTLNDNRNTLEGFKGDVKNSTDKVLQDILDNRPTLVQANDWLSDALNGISKNKSIIDQIIGAMSGLFLGLTIANVAVAVIAIVSILLVCCGAKMFNKSVHFSWCTLGLLMIIGWLISTVLFALTIVLSETCDVGNQAIQSPEFFNKTFDRLGTMFDLNTGDFNKTRSVLYRCVHGDGDLSQEFNLSNNLVFFNDIFANINQISTDATQNLNGLPETIADSQVSVLNEFKEGLIPDSEETIEDLVTLNVLTTNEANTCTFADDVWVLNSQNCTSANGISFAATNAADFNVPQATCIGYNAWSASQNNIADRYTQSIFSGTGCDNTNNNAFAVSYINSLAANREQSNTLINDLELGVNDLEIKYTNFKAELQRTPQTLEDTNSTVAEIYISLTDEQNGLISNTNCKFIVNSVEELRDVTCTGLGATVYQTTIAFLVLSFVTFFGTLFLFCLAKRFTVKPVGKKVDADTYVVGKVDC